MSGIKLLVILGIVGVALGGPALAGRILDQINAFRSETGNGPGQGGGSSHSAPGPVAGLGLPLLGAAGAYIWFVQRNRRTKRERPEEQA